VNLNNALDYFEEEKEPVTVYDNPTNVTQEQVSKFICEESMILDLHTSPYSVKVNNTK
jgi:hypothetical protein